jgi:hypothetical protein
MKVEIDSSYMPHEQKVTVTLTCRETGRKVSDWAKATSSAIADRVEKKLIDQLMKVL